MSAGHPWMDFERNLRLWGFELVRNCRLAASRSRKKTSLWDCIVLQLFQSMLALVGPSVKNAVKIGVSRGVVSLFGCVCVLLETRGP